MRRTGLVVLLGFALATSACGGREGGPPVRPAVPQLQATPRQVVYTAALAVRVNDAALAAEQAASIARDAGGFVFAQTSDLPDRRESRLTLKVPSDQFEPALAAVGRLGRPLERSVEAEDVTDQVVDLDGRLRTASTSADRLRTLLAEATSTADVVAIEGELAKREAEVESLLGRLRVVTTRVALATIDATLTERAGVGVSQDLPRPVQALRAGWITFVNVVLAVAAAATFLLPFAPFGALAWWAANRSCRRRGRDVPAAVGEGDGV